MAAFLPGENICTLLCSEGSSGTVAAFLVSVAWQNLCCRAPAPISLVPLPSVCALVTFIIGLFSSFHGINENTFSCFMEAIFTSPKLSLQNQRFSCNNLPLTLLPDVARSVPSLKLSGFTQMSLTVPLVPPESPCIGVVPYQPMFCWTS